MNMMRTCKVCEKEKKYSEFPRRSDTGRFGYTCKKCISEFSRIQREKKHIVSRRDVQLFLDEMLNKEILSKCRCCGKEKLANQFYTKRDYGKIYLVTTRCRECERWYQIECTFGITKDQYFNILDMELQSNFRGGI